MQKIKEYKGIIIISLVILGIAFYWYEWRPSEIRKRCANYAGDNFSIGSGLVDNVYEDCVRRNGL